MTTWNLKTHTHSKVYEVNMANMNAMIADIERLEKVVETAKLAIIGGSSKGGVFRRENVLDAIKELEKE